MQRAATRKKIGSALAAFENTISKNQEYGAGESKSFLTGVAASSPSRKYNSTRKWTPRKASKLAETATCSPLENDSSLKAESSSSEKMILLPAPPLTSTSNDDSSSSSSSAPPTHKPLVRPAKKLNSDCSCESEDIFCFSLSPRSMSRKALHSNSSNNNKKKMPKPTLSNDSLNNEFLSPSCSTTFVEPSASSSFDDDCVHTANGEEATCAEDIKAVYGYEEVVVMTRAELNADEEDQARTTTRRPASPQQQQQSNSRCVSEDAPLAKISPTPLSSPHHRSRRRSSIAGEFPSTNPGSISRVPSDRDLIKQDLMKMGRRSISPSRRARQNAVRNTVTQGLRQFSPPSAPRRQKSDPDAILTSGTSVSCHVKSFEPTRDVSPIPQKKLISPKKRKNKKISNRVGKFDVEFRKQRELELRIEAQKYNPADHGLVGILKWKPKPKGLRIRWAKQLTQTRRASLDLSLSDKASTNDKALPRQPRRRSMDDMSMYSHPPTFLENAKKKRTLSLLKTAFRASMLFTIFQHDRFCAATRIQALARRFRQRLRYPVLKLEYQLQEVEKQRKRELSEIQKNKWEQMEKIRYDAEAPARKQADVVAKAQELIKYLRDENTKIEAKNSKITSSMNQMKKMNKHFRDSTQLLLDNLSTMTEAIDTLTEKNHELILIHAKYEAEANQLQADLAELDGRAEQAKNAREKTEETILRITAITELRCEDATLVADTKSLWERVQEETPSPRLGGLPSFVGRDTGDTLIMSNTVRSDISARTFAKSNNSFRSYETSGSCSFANVTVDDDQMTALTNDSFASAWTQ